MFHAGEHSSPRVCVLKSRDDRQMQVLKNKQFEYELRLALNYLISVHMMKNKDGMQL